MVMKKNIFLWALYDFANSIVSISFFLYFSQWYVVEQGIADIWFNSLFTGTAVLLLFTVPFVGRALDRGYPKLVGLRMTTVASFVFYCGTALFAIYSPGSHILISLFFLLGMYSYLLSFTFYTPFISNLSNDTNRGKISGIGICANYLGQLVAVVICLPFANEAISFFSASPKLEPLLPTTIIFFILALPMLFFFKDSSRIADEKTPSSEKGVISDFVSLCATNGLGFFFLSYFLFNDGILTAANNFPIYLEQVFAVSDTLKSAALGAILIGSAIGAPVFGFLADKYGHKKMLALILWVMFFIFVFLAVAIIISTVSVTNVVANMPDLVDIQAVAKFFVAAFAHADIVIKSALVAGIAFFVVTLKGLLGGIRVTAAIQKA